MGVSRKQNDPGKKDRSERLGLEDEIYAKCEVIMEQLDIPRPFTVEAFLAAIEMSTGRPIRLETFEFRSRGRLGLLLRLDTEDLILIDSRARDTRRLQVLCHEAAHIILDHQALTDVLDEGQDLNIPDGLLHQWNLERLQEIWHRWTYSAREDKEAEVLADLILERIETTSRPATHSQDPNTVELSERLLNMPGRTRSR